jgi:PD-(D/E)XK nuclease superfamily protein
MAQLRLVTACDPELLLRHAADGFLVRRVATLAEPFPTVPYLLALRQGGLRDDVIEMAAEAKIPGWFDPPICVFHELPEWLGVAESDVLGEFERHVLLSRILRDTGSAVFAKLPRPDDFVDGVDRLFGELISEGVVPETFAGALEERTDRDDFERRRDADLSQAYARYNAELVRLRKSDGRDTLCQCASAVRSGDASLAKSLRGRREIRIFGLQDLRGGWRLLLRAFADSTALDSVSIYTSVALPLGDLPVEVEPIDETPTVAARLFLGVLEKTGTAALVIAPDIDRELESVARRIRELIDGGAVPNRIAVISRKARPHVDVALAALRRFGVPAMARQRIRVADIPPVRAIRALFAAAAGDWTRWDLVELAQQPYLNCGLDARIVNSVGFAERVTGLANWENAIRSLERRATEYERRVAAGELDESSHARPLPPAADVTRAREAFSKFAVRAKALDRRQPLLAWLDWLEKFVSEDPWGILKHIHEIPHDRFDIARRDLAGWNGLLRIVSEWREAVAQFGSGGESLDVEAFSVQLHAYLDGDVIIWTPANRGVQVLEGFAAAYRSFDHVFIVGMEAGAFPANLPRSSIFEQSEREALALAGLPLEPSDVWEERERELFRVLVASPRQLLTLSFARLDENGREVSRSSFVEELADVTVLNETAITPSEVVTPGRALYVDADGPRHAERGARIERERQVGRLSPYNGQIRRPELVEWLATAFGDDRLWSPTQLEEFAKCPWAYFAKRVLRLEHLEDPDDIIVPSARGFLLHRVLHRVYDAAKERVGGPVFLRESDESWVTQLVDDALAIELAEHDGWLGHPALREARQAELRRIALGFLRWEMGEHEAMINPGRRRNIVARVRTAVSEHEIPFEDMIFERDGVRIKYRGSIDRVEVSIDERLPGVPLLAAVDYKTTVYSTPGSGKKEAWADGVVLQVPLYAHALEKLRPGYGVARVEYLVLKKPDEAHTLQLYQLSGKSRGGQPDPAAMAQWQSALGAAVGHVESARRGDFPAGPPPSCSCPPWCHGIDICRVKGGPRMMMK